MLESALLAENKNLLSKMVMAQMERSVRRARTQECGASRAEVLRMLLGVAIAPPDAGRWRVPRTPANHTDVQSVMSPII